MPHLSEFGAIEVIGTSGEDAFNGRPETVFFGRQGADVLTSTRDVFTDQWFFGGSGNDTYVVRTGTSVVLGDGFGSTGDVLRVPGIGFNFPYTVFAELDGRHLLAADYASSTDVLILDWSDPARRIERIELADGARVNLTPEQVRALPNYAGNFTFEEAFTGAPAGFADLFRSFIRTGFARAAELESTPQPNLVQIIGTPGDDVLEGDARPEIITGLGGSDLIFGRGGNDEISGSAGDDTIAGNTGNDILYGNRGADVLEGGRGFDQLFGDLDDDQLFGGAHADQLFGNRGADVLRGGGDNDLLDGGQGSDQLFGDAGDDLLRGGLGGDLLEGGDGNDALLGNRGEDTLRGGPGSDVLDGGFDADVLEGGGAADTFRFTVLDGELDRVLDFDLEADELDLSPLLPGFGPEDTLESFVQFTSAAEGTTIGVDRSGSGTDFTNVVLLEGVNVDSLPLDQLGLPTTGSLSLAALVGDMASDFAANVA